MVMTKRPEGIHRHRVPPVLPGHPPQRYEIRFKGTLVGYTRRVAPRSRSWVAEPADDRPWERFPKHLGAEEYLSGPYQAGAQKGFGQAFHKADEAANLAARDPFSVDPDLINRGNRGHAKTLNALADYLVSRGAQPLEPSSADPRFDLGWIQAGICFVAEVKSLTEANEEHQLRLGLGQLLRYQHALLQRFEHVIPVLAVEYKPRDSAWNGLSDRLGVRLVWPPEFHNLDYDLGPVQPD
jgi:hypothetical protein